jgi:hypothetical protein
MKESEKTKSEIPTIKRYFFCRRSLIRKYNVMRRPTANWVLDERRRRMRN